MDRIGRRIFRRIVLVAVLVMVVGIGLFGLRAITLLSAKVGPELEANAAVIGERVQSRIEAAVAMGIPLDALVGVEPYLASARAAGPGVSGLVLRAADGRLLHADGLTAPPGAASGSQTPSAGAGVSDGGASDGGPSDGGAAGRDRLAEAGARLLARGEALLPDARAMPGALILPIRHEGTEIGSLEVVLDRLYMARQLREVALDIVVLAGVAVLLAVELLIIVTARALGGPLGQFGRIAGRLRGRDFTATAAPAGPGAVVALIAAANALATRVDAAARALRDRLQHEAAAAEAGARRISQAGLRRAEAGLARVGRFAAGGMGRMSATDLIGVRGAAFLFVLAEELTRPFMPLFIRGFVGEVEGADNALLIAVPISAFMLGLALAGPLAASFSDRVGRRRSFMLGALVSTGGLVWAAMAGSLEELVLARALSGLGYALTFVACQGHVIDKTDAGSRTAGMSVFVGGIMAADICGPAIGGILADQLGYRATLFVAAGVALLAALTAVALLDDESRRGPGTGHGFGLRVAGACLANPRFMAVVLLAAIPAKLILTGFLFFLVPLLMVEIGATEAEIGRVAMLYGIAALLLLPVFAGLTDRYRGHGFMVGVGALLVGWALVPLMFGPSMAVIAVAVLALGVGQAMSIPAQAALITLVSARQMDTHGPGPVLGVYRLAERLGSVLGPLIAAQSVQSFGLAQTGAMFGFLAIGVGTLFSALFLTIGLLPDTEGRSRSVPHESDVLP